MHLFSSLVLGVYFTSLLSFSFVTHPVSYCFLLLTGALSAAGYAYLVLGFSWYLALFCLVYVGGVYVLFIFVSIHNPNPLPSFGGDYVFIALSYLFLSLLLVGSGYKFNSGMCESSHYLCSYFEGLTYLVFCVVLMLGFIVLSVVSSDKDSFFR